MKYYYQLFKILKEKLVLLLFFLALGANAIAQTYTEVENNNTIGNALASSQVRKFGPGNFEGTVSSSDSDFWVVSRKSDQATQIKLLVHTNYVGSPSSVDFRVWEYTGGNWGVSGSVVGTLKSSPNPGILYYEVALNYQNNLNGGGISNNYYALEVFTTSATPINYSIPFNPSIQFPYCYELTVPVITPLQVNDTDVTLPNLRVDTFDDRYYIVKFSATNSFTDFTDHYIQDQALPIEAATNLYSGSGEHIVYVGTDNGAIQSAMSMTNLQRNTTYYYKVYTYSNCQGYINYNNTGTPVAVTTCPGTVPGTGSVNSVSPTSPTTATINTLGRPAGADTSMGYLVKISDTNSFTAPLSGTTIPTASADYSGKTGEQVVYTGAVGSVAGTTDDINQVITGLQINTNYYVKVYTYDLCGGTYNFETTGSTVVTTNYVCAAPSSAVTGVNANVTGTATMDISSFTPPSNTSQGTLAYVVKVSDTDSFTVPTGAPASSNTVYNTVTGGEQVVYVGTSASPNISITSLAEVTTYYVKVYAYNTCAGTDYFEAIGSTSVAITTCGTPTGNSELNSFRTDLHWENRVSPIISNVPVGVEGQIVKMNRENSFSDITGSLNTLPTADVNYSGSGEQVILAGAFPEGQAFTGHNLLPNTQYFFKIYSYKECSGIYYFSNTSDAISTYTAGVTTNLASNATINNFTGTAFTLASFSAPAVSTNGNPKGYIVKINTTNSFTPHSFRGPIPTPDADYKGGEQVVYVGSSITPNQVITGLTPNTTYYFTIYAYTDSGAPYFRNSYQQTGHEFSIVNNGSLVTPTITFDNVTVNVGDANFNLNGTSDSTGAISYQIIDDGGTGTTLSGTNNETVTVGGSSGVVIVKASQEATATHQSAVKTMILTIDNPRATLSGFIGYQVNSGIVTLDMTTTLGSNSTGAYSFSIIGPDLGYSITGNLLNVNNVAGSIIIEVTQAADANYGETVGYYSTLFYNGALTPKVFAAHNLFDFSIDAEESKTIQESINAFGTPTTYSIVDDGGTGSTISGNIFTAGMVPGTVTLRSSSIEDPGYLATTKDVTVTVIRTGTLPQSITFGALATKTYGDTTFNLTATSDSGLPVSYVSSDTSVATISGSTVTIVGNGTTRITASQAGDVVYDPALDVTQDLTVGKRSIEVTADTGQSKEQGASDPVFAYSITNGNLVGSDTFTGALSRNTGETVGTYPITQGTLALSANYDLSFVSNNFEITKRTATVTINDLTQTYDGGAKPVSVTTNPIGLTVDVTYDGGTTVPTSAGDYTVVATINDPNYQGSTTETLTITKATAAVTINDLAQTYDGTTKPVSVNTIPNGLTVDVTYDGGTTVPTDTGNYAVVATINDTNYQGTSNETLTINKADQAITFAALTAVTYGDVDFNLTATASSSLAVSFTSSNTAVATVSGNTVTIIGAGTTTITASQVGDANYNAATTVPQVLVVNKKDLEVTPVVTSIEYGLLLDQSGTVPLNVTGFVNGDDSSTLTPTGGGFRVEYFEGVFTGIPRNVGIYTNGARVTEEGTTPYEIHPNYNYTYPYVSLEIVPREVTVTANTNQSKVYGATDPVLTYTPTPLPVNNNPTGTVYNFNTFALSGNLARAAGENAGTYAINQGALDATTGNYNVNFVSDTFEITTRTIEITADAKSKTYGDADPILTYQITSGALQGSDTFTGSLTRATGENVGTHAIQQGTLSAGANYTLTFVSDDLTISQRAIEVTADAKTKIYGDADPTFTYTITSGSLAGSDSFTGALARVTGQAQGNYAVNQGTLSLGANYNLTFVPGNLYIDYRFIRILPTATVQKTYGNPDPVFSVPYVLNLGSLAFDDTIEVFGNFRESGEDVGNYFFRSGLSADITSTNGGGSSYQITFMFPRSTYLEILPRAIEVTADVQAKTYGDADPTLSYQVTNGALQFSDTFSGSLTRVAGEDVGTYGINQGTLSAGSNYTITYVGNDLTIGRRAIEITADALNKQYGDSDPVLTYQITSGNLIGSDAFTGNLTRVAGETIGAYAIQQGMITAGGNYTITFVSNNLTIGKRTIEVTADAKTKIYGDADPAFTYQITNGSLVGSDAFTGTLDRAAGQAQGNYAINQGTLSLGGNYNLTFVPGNLFINYRFIRVIPVAPISKTYGDADPDLTWPYIITQGSLAFDDTLETYGTFRTPGENIGRYQIRGLSARFTSTNGGESSYSITFTNGGSVSLDITARAIEVTADVQHKIYGDADPNLSYQVTNGALQFSDTFTGSLTRVTGESVGAYAINQGTLSAGRNYAISYVGDDLTIGQRAITITADDQIKVIGSADPTFTHQVTSGALQFSDTVTGSLTRVAGETLGNYAINQGTLSVNSNYNLTFVAGTLNITNKIPQIITFGTLTDRTYGDANFALTATGGASGNPITYVSSNTAVATISGNTVTIVGVGTTTITASQAGNATYADAVDVPQLLTVNKGDQTITFNALPNVTIDDADFNLTATASSGLGVTYTSSDPTVATVTGNVVSIVGLGTTTITASQAGDTNWNVATDVLQSLTVVEACPLVNLSANNFQIQTVSETCTDKNNGSISITAVSSQNYTTNINGQAYSFTTALTVDNLTPGTYPICIAIDGFSNCERCFEAVIEAASVLAGKTEIISGIVAKEVQVHIESGTAPYTVMINDEVIGTYATNSFSVSAKNGDTVEVTSSIACEGKLLKSIVSNAGISAYPNPTQSDITLTIPEGRSTIAVTIHNMLGTHVLTKTYAVIDNKVIIPMSAMQAGVYFVQVSESSEIIKIIKE
ncbi:MBG domain-containing protein [Aquimarina sp. 2201CG1-2-11]|uniref:MBG domain-containing protein n=1 Tax=Aquimarina discodermiae TaxID=3231043 RepID=UPI0034635405